MRKKLVLSLVAAAGAVSMLVPLASKAAPAKAACVACHTIGYVGGHVGPDLSRVGAIRQERDLVESILYPSASFVQS